MRYDLARRLTAEALGTFFLVMAVVGSGIMAEELADGNVALALLCNTLATAAILVVLITIFVSVSGAQFNPAVTLVMRLRGEIGGRTALLYVVAQIAAGCLGAIAAHLMFGSRPFRFRTPRDGFGHVHESRTRPDRPFPLSRFSPGASCGGRPLYRISAGLLVHAVHPVREPCCCHRAVA
jgi:glycerol uptake facilitator-like aquaporin